MGLETYGKKYGGQAYLVFRLLVGLMFFLHGWQKFAGGNAAGLMLAAAVMEVVIGAVVFFGLFTRLAALLGGVEMLVAYFKMHFALTALSPLVNKGELALLYFAAFLILATYGNGKGSLEQVWLKKETF